MKRGCGSSRKRQQLFGASPAGLDDDFRALPSSVFSPDTSIDSPGTGHIGGRGERHGRGNFRGNYSSQKCSPQCGSQRSLHSQQTPEQRSKQKFSLAEFMFTPDQCNNTSNSWKKKSPHSAGKKEFSIDNTPSPAFNQGRKSGGKKRHSYSPLIQNNVQDNTSNNCNQDRNSGAPVFSLSSSSDFPPMCSTSSQKKGRLNRRSLDSNLCSVKTSDCDIKTSRVINFSNNNNCDSTALTRYAQERLKDVKRVSPLTVQSSTTGVRRITPTLLKADNSTLQNSAFLVPIDEVGKTYNTSSSNADDDPFSEQQSSKDPLVEERELLK